MTTLDKPARSVTRVTAGTLGYGHGADRDRTLVCCIAYGDTLVLKPKGRREGSAVVLPLIDLYTYGLKCRVNKAHMEKLRERKAKKAERAQAARSRRIIRGGLTS